MEKAWVMVRFIMCAGVFLALFSSNPAHAVRTPDCGDLKRREIKETFTYAYRLRYIYDVRDQFSAACDVLETFKDWKKENRKKDGYDAGEEQRKKRSKAMESDLKVSGYSLKAMFIWAKALPESDSVLEWLKRDSHMKLHKRKIKEYLERLQENGKALRELMVLPLPADEAAEP